MEVVFEVLDEQVLKHGLGCVALELLIELPPICPVSDDVADMVRRLAARAGGVLDATKGHLNLAELVQACRRARPASFAS